MTLLAKDKITVSINNRSLFSVEHPKTIHLRWYSAAAMVSVLIFVLLNILPISFGQLTESAKQSSDSNAARSKLEHFVKTSSYESEQFGPWPWWVARAYFSTQAPDIVAMGDSQINAAFIQADAIALNKSRDCVTDRDCVALKKSLQHLDKKYHVDNLQLVNLAMGGAMPSDYYLMSKAFFTKEHHPKIVILSLSPRSFLDATLNSASATETFQFLSPFVDLGNLSDYAFSNPVEKYFWLIKNQLAVFKYRQDINLAVHSFIEQLFNSIHTTALNSKAEEVLFNRLPVQPIYGGGGSVSVGSNVVTPNPHVPFRGNKPEYERRFAQLKSQTLVAQSTYFLATLKYLRALGIKVVVVDMPMLNPVRDLLPASFWNNYSAQLKRDCQTNRAYWLDLSNDTQFSQADFLDYVHLNAYGGQKFVDRLAIPVALQHQTIISERLK
jgi:hypothetical protein